MKLKAPTFSQEELLAMTPAQIQEASTEQARYWAAINSERRALVSLENLPVTLRRAMAMVKSYGFRIVGTPNKYSECRTCCGSFISENGKVGPRRSAFCCTKCQLIGERREARVRMQKLRKRVPKTASHIHGNKS